MTVIGVHEYGLRSGTCFLACTVCEHSGVKSGVTGVQLPRVSSPRSHVLSQHMMCLCSNRDCHKLASCTAADKLIRVQAGSGAYSTQASSHTNVGRIILLFSLCPALIVQTESHQGKFQSIHCTLLQTPLSMVSEVTRQSPVVFSFPSVPNT